MIFAESKECKMQPLFGKEGYITDQIYKNTSVLSKITEKDLYERLKGKM